jgi:Tfp pilus assembly protein PilP
LAKVHRPAAPQVPASAPTPGAESAEPVVSRRDPFSPLVYVARAEGTGEHLPPGKAGLVVSTVHVDGAVQSPNGMIAVVSNPEQRVYFVREGDHLYDGYVEKISLEGVTFKENSKDAFGKPVERLVTKRIYPSAGEQQ